MSTLFRLLSRMFEGIDCLAAQGRGETAKGESAAQKYSQFRQRLRCSGLMQDRQQHELFEGHIRDPAVKKRLESVGENEQHAEDSP